MFFNETQTQNDPTLDEDALNFLQILEQLAEENVEEEQEEPQDDDEDEMDLSMPLGSVTTPVKSAPQPEEDLDSTLIPQIDGMHEDDDEKQKKQFKGTARSMPSLEGGYVAVDKLKLKAYVKLHRLDISKYLELPKIGIKKKSVKKTTFTVDEALEKLKWKIKMIQSRNRVGRLGRVFKRKVGDLKNWKSPKFKLRPALPPYAGESFI